MAKQILDGDPSGKNIFRELHNEEIQEIVSKPPHWLIRWGIGLCFFVVGLLLFGAWWIRYPDIVTAPFILTSSDAPREVLARIDGKLTRILKKDGEKVQTDEILAYLESTTDPAEALMMERYLDSLGNYVTTKDWSKVRVFDTRVFRRLGELQNDFQIFYLHLTQLKTYLEGGVILRKRELLLEDIQDLKEMSEVLKSQQSMQQRDFELAEEEYGVQERLYNDKVIPYIDLKKEQAKLLARESPLKQIEASQIQNRSLQTAKQKELIELDNAVDEAKTTFIHALLSLQSALDAWKQRHIMVAPVMGRVSYLAPWQEQQTIRAGSTIMLVEPEDKTLNGLVKIPQVNLGKLRNGQEVLVKLDGYPFREFGLIKGSLANLSVTPGKDSTYWATVMLPKGLRTRYGHTLAYKNGMKGTADIITDDQRLLERLLVALRGGGMQQNK